MPWPTLPTFHLTISGSVLAAYAAVLSTATGAAQLWTYYRDRANIKVTVQPNMEMIGEPRYSGKQLCIIKVANLGRRPVTITTVGAYLRTPGRQGIVVADCQPHLPHELTEGTSLIGIFEKGAVDLTNILWWHATDAVGHEYRSKGGHWLARKKLYRSWKKEAARERSK
jgi:hypothetical protein